MQEEPVCFTINMQRRSIRILQRSPINSGMIAFELRIDNRNVIFTCNGVVIGFLPNAVACPPDAVFLYTVRTVSQPLHSFYGTLRIRESEA